MKFRPVFDREAARAAKLQAGDSVTIGDGEQYTVVATGLRYSRLQSASGRLIGLVRNIDCRKSGTQPEPSPFDELNRQQPCEHLTVTRC